MAFDLRKQGGSRRNASSRARVRASFWSSAALTVACGLLIWTAAEAREVQAFSRAYGPKREMLIATPTLRWEVWAGKGRITSSAMRLNGKRVDARYDSTERALSYTPARPLAPGRYKVECEVQIDGWHTMKRDWEFQVASQALPCLPAVDDGARQAMDSANALRAQVGLTPFLVDERLCAASLAHSQYLRRNSRSGHSQIPGDPGFFGRGPSERLEAYGYFDGSWECVNSGSSDPVSATYHLFHAPYHRLPFLQPGRDIRVGAGLSGDRLTLAFGMSETAGVTTSPAEGQQQVPTAWDAFENPDPLRIHLQARKPVGYPIVFGYFQPEGEGIVVQKASLTCEGTAIPIFVNSPSNDRELSAAAFLIPHKPLRPNTRYTASVTARTAKGQDISRTWSFRTAP